MRAILDDLGIGVRDDFLAPAEFEQLRADLATLRYRRVDNREGTTAWSIAEEPPRESPILYSDSTFDRSDPRQAALERFARQLAASLNEFHGLMGVEPGEGVRFNLRSWLYPQRSGLTWHRDPGRAGAFAYYFHETWSPRWGGELQVADPGDDTYGAGRYFAPVPNRLVIIRSGTPHRIGLVSPAAGEHVRLSLSGFFFRQGDAEFAMGMG
jgi:Rps23 Pro-64 3,4-dihydroxylase Tpa1-like proline 4-hydroxylase